MQTQTTKALTTTGLALTFTPSELVALRAISVMRDDAETMAELTRALAISQALAMETTNV